jgi:hypothetical protein
MYNLKYTLPKLGDFNVTDGLPFLLDEVKENNYSIFYH